jgi:hypothetical protein
MDSKNSGSGFLAGLKKAGGPINDANGPMKGIAFGGLKSTGGTLPPLPPLPLKGMQVSGPGVGKGLPVNSITTENGFGMPKRADIDGDDSKKGGTTKFLREGFQKPLNVPLDVSASIEGIRTDESEYSRERDVANDSIDIGSNDDSISDRPIDDVATNNDNADEGVVAGSLDGYGNKEAATALPLQRTGTDETYSVGKWSTDKQIGTGASFAPKAFTPPESRPRPISLEIVDAVIDLESANNDDMFSYSVQEDRNEPSRQPKQPTKLFSGESFYGTAASRVYGLGSIRPSKSGGSSLENPRESKDEADKSDGKRRATADKTKAAGEVESIRDDLEESVVTAEEKKKEEALVKKRAGERRRIEDEMRLIKEKSRVATLLADAERKLAQQLERMEEERKLTKAELALAARERVDAEKRVLDLEVTRATEVRSLEKRLAEERALTIRQLKEEQEKYLEQARVREFEEARRIEEQNKFVQRRLEERVAEEKAKANAEISKTKRRLKEEAQKLELERARARADEEARWIQEQNELVQKRLDERILEEKSKINVEMTYVRQKLRDEQEQADAERGRVDQAEWVGKLNQLLEERLEERLAELKKEHNSQVTTATYDASPSAKSTITQNADIAKVAGNPATSDSEPASADVLDALAADVEALQIVSLCEAEFDMKSPSSNVRSTSERGVAGEIPSLYPFVSLLRDSSPYIVNHRHSTIVYHIPGDLISNVARFNSVMDDISLTYLFGMKIVICVGCRKQVLQRLKNKAVNNFGKHTNLDIRVTDAETLHIVEEEAGFCRFEVERLLNRCLRNKGADCNVVSGCFVTAKKFGVVDGVDYQVRQYPL